MNYKLIREGVQRVEDGARIPNDLANRDWQDYLVWVAAGNTPLAADPPPPKPTPQQIVDLIAAAKDGDNPSATALMILCKGLAAGAIVPGTTTLNQMKTYMVNNWPQSV